MSLRKSILTAAVVSQFALAQSPSQPPSELPISVTDLSQQQWTEAGEGAVRTIRSSVADVAGKLMEAQQSKDIVKLNCVNDKLTRMKALLRVSEQSNVKLIDAASSKNVEVGDHEWTKLRLAFENVRNLKFDAEQCMGEVAFRTQEEQSTEVEEPKLMFETDPTLALSPSQAASEVTQNTVSSPPPSSPTN